MGHAVTWAKFEDRFPWHRKVRGLSDAAFRLHVSAVCWSCEHLTDGMVMRSELHLLSDVRRPTTSAKELTTAGLWDENDERTGWELHDFLVYNESRETVKNRREADAERKRQGRAATPSPAQTPEPPSDRPSGVQPESKRSPAGIQAESAPESVRPDPARPAPTSKHSLTPLAEPPSGFAEFWLAYPRKIARKKAEAAYRKALKTTGPDVILDAARSFAVQRQGQDQTYTPHPSSWLNAGRWDDAPDPVAHANRVLPPKLEWLRYS